MSSDKEETAPRYYGLEFGQVVDRDDPEGLGRIRIIVPGIIDEPSGWVSPVGGTLFGGGPQRGFFGVPPKGADVGVLFHRGDPERPYYLPAHYGKPSTGEEVPTDVKEAPAKDRADVYSFETELWKLTFDDRKSNSKARIAHKALDLVLDLDGEKGVLEITGEAAINIKSNGFVNVDGAHVQIAGRVVMKTGKPIS